MYLDGIFAPRQCIEGGELKLLAPPELGLEQIDCLTEHFVESLGLAQWGVIGSFPKFQGRIRKRTRRMLGAGLRHLGYRGKPAFLIVGTQKGGTRALWHYLAAHPLVVEPRRLREPHFPEPHFFDQNCLYRRGLIWYSQLFPLPHALWGAKQAFECTTTYMYYPKATERIRRHLPRVKLIVLLREPISRAFSAWNMFRQFHEHPEQVARAWRQQFDPAAHEALISFVSRDPFPDFATAVREELSNVDRDGEVPQPGLIARGFYDEQLARIFATFGGDHVLVLESSQLRSRPREVLDQTVDFLRLPRWNWPDRLLVPHNPAEYIDTMDSSTRSILTEVFRPHNDRLFELLGVDLGWNRTP